jgi:serine/threonine protein kinase/HPt (histidine-containing phosphotransfer) domain-containing protein
MRMIVADHDSESLELIRRVATARGHEVVACRDGHEASRALEKGASVLVAAWDLRGVNGPTLCRKARGLAADRRPFVVLVAHLTDTDCAGRDFELDADEYLLKPLEADHLAARVDAWASNGTATRPAPPVKKHRDLVGTTLDGKYEVQELLGRGAMGAVYKARHVLLGETVAIKVMNDQVAASANTRERFLREARAMLRFVHPNAIPVRDCGLTAEGILYMTLGFSSGKTLRSILGAEKKLPIPRALAIARQCLQALAEAHSHGIVHRDLKPENIMIEAPGTDRELVRICDFGLAKFTSSLAQGLPDITGCAVIGTPHYMPPEQVLGEAIDARSDIYALGCVLYELISGARLFPGREMAFVLMAQAREKPAKLSTHLEVPPKLDALLERMLAKKKEDRFQSAAEVLAAIEALTPARAARPLYILVAEDSLVSQRLTSRMLEKWGHKVSVAGNGVEALERIEESAFDLVLMDGDMPELDGFEATRRIREREKKLGGRVPIIALTAYDGEEDRRRCLTAGMDDYVPKPVVPERLFRTIETIAALPSGAYKKQPSVRAFDGTCALARAGGDQDLLREIATAFVQEAPRLVTAIRSALARGDRTAVSHAAHDLKGAAGDCSANVIAQISDKIEKLAQVGDLAGASRGASSLDRELEAVLETLRGVAGVG